MRTFTIEIPEEAYEAALTIPLDERREAITDAIFATARNVVQRQESDDYKLTPEDIEAIGEGLADLDAGRTIPAEEVFAAARERFGWKK